MVNVSQVRFDFESLYKRYPRKEGKKRGMNRLRVTIKTSVLFAEFEKAMDEYISLCLKEAREPRFVKHWGTFVNNWTDYKTKGMAVDKTTKKMVIESQVDRILKGDL